jgi:DNA-directed RNA polymerase subunit alpha
MSPAPADSSPNIDQLLETALLDAYKKGYADGSAETRAMIHLKLQAITGTNPILNKPIDVLELSERPLNSLSRYWYWQQKNNPNLGSQMLVSDLIKLTEDDLLAITNIGNKSLDEVVQKLKEHGLKLQPDIEMESRD